MKEMSDNVSRRGAADMGMLLMILAFAVIGGFMFWLNGQAAAERQAQLDAAAARAAAGGRRGRQGRRVRRRRRRRSRWWCWGKILTTLRAKLTA